MTKLPRSRPVPVVLSTNLTPRAGGFTLIEVVLVLTLFSTLLASTISLVTIVKRSDRQASRSFQHRQDIRRFADDVRRDLHRGDDVQINGNEVVIRNQREVLQTIYEIRSNTTIARVVLDSDQNSIASEIYQVGIEAQIEVQWLQEDRLIQWTLTETNRESQPLVIAAALRSTSP